MHPRAVEWGDFGSFLMAARSMDGATHASTRAEGWHRQPSVYHHFIPASPSALGHRYGADLVFAVAEGEATEFETLRRAVIIAIGADDFLWERLVLKCRNALRIVYGIGAHCEFHRVDWGAAREAVGGAPIQNFDFYVDFVLKEIAKLRALGAVWPSLLGAQDRVDLGLSIDPLRSALEESHDVGPRDLESGRHRGVDPDTNGKHTKYYWHAELRRKLRSPLELASREPADGLHHRWFTRYTYRASLQRPPADRRAASRSFGPDETH